MVLQPAYLPECIYLRDFSVAAWGVIEYKLDFAIFKDILINPIRCRKHSCTKCAGSQNALRNDSQLKVSFRTGTWEKSLRLNME